MIYEKILELRCEVEAKYGKVLKITLDKEGDKLLRKELEAPFGCLNRLYGIVIETPKDCPTCGQSMKEKDNGRKVQSADSRRADQ